MLCAQIMLYFYRMRKFVIWLKINWIKILLILLFAAIAVGMGMYVSYIVRSYSKLENFAKTQQSGMMAMYMPMSIFSQLLTLPFLFAMYYYIMRGGGMGVKKEKIDQT